MYRVDYVAEGTDRAECTAHGGEAEDGEFVRGDCGVGFFTHYTDMRGVLALRGLYYMFLLHVSMAQTVDRVCSVSRHRVSSM